MVDGPDDTSGDGGSADEGKILSPHELDITDSEYVEEIDEGRFVVSPETRGSDTSADDQPEPSEGSGGRLSGGEQSRSSGSTPRRGSSTTSTPGDAARGPTGSKTGGGAPELSEEDVRRWLRQRYEGSHSKYAFDVTAQFDGQISQRQMASNDLITVFESLMLWYAQQVDSTTPVEEVLGILLMESNVPVRYPPESVKNLIKSTDLGPDDTIADLLEAIQHRDGVQL